MADEAGFLELLIANERIGRALDMLCDPYQRKKYDGNLKSIFLSSQGPTKQQHAISQLQQDLQRGASYVEEANRLGAVAILTKLLSSTSDEATLDQLSNMISLCSGPMACGGKVSNFTYGDLSVAVREGALGDGLGAKVWSVCHIMVRELLAHPEIFKGQQVLELGSGTGLVGLVAALAGAQQVVLTDHEDKVLLNLRTCMHMNVAMAQQSLTASPAPAALVAAKQEPQQQQQQQQAGHFEVPDDAELFDNAESVEDFDLGELMTGQPAAAAGAVAQNEAGGRQAGAGTSADAAAQQTAWDAANMCVRLLDWQESEEALLQEEEQQQQESSQPQQQQQHEPADSSMAPHVPLSQRFPVILGNEVMYEVAHARLVAAALKHRLAEGGRALLCCAVRDQAVFDMFRDTCSRWGLRYRAVRVQPQGDEDLGGIVGRERDYEGGYLLMAVDHAAAPAPDWHRDDFAAVN